MSRTRLFFLNAMWLLCALPAWMAFLLALRFPRHAQQRLLRRIWSRNRETDFGRLRRLADVRDAEQFGTSVPLSDYSDYAAWVAAIQGGAPCVLTREPVLRLQPTSGTTSRPKLIPFTGGLQRQFQAAVDPWIADLFLRFPRLLCGRHYWCISPNSGNGPDVSKAGPAAGFPDDTEYLGRWARRAWRGLSAAPSALAEVRDPRAFEYLTLLFLVRERNLRLISVWHPSFLTVLLDAFPVHQAKIVEDIACGAIQGDLPMTDDLRRRLTSGLRPAEKRACEVAAVNARAPAALGGLWPNLQVISCWGGRGESPWLKRLRDTFPGVHIQPKGLIATEGIVSLPFGRHDAHVCAVRSHYLEFLDGEADSAHAVWEIRKGGEYSVVITTAGGLYRYATNDRVRVTGFLGRVPCLEFISRGGQVTDLVGEKLHLNHVEEALSAAESTAGCRFEFAMLAPDAGVVPPRYVLYVRAASGSFVDWLSVARSVETALFHNYHYRHARNLSQLGPLAVFEVSEGADKAYRETLVRRGVKPGDIKFLRLQPDLGWRIAFRGRFAAAT